jgi:choice-of-anchor B domain-containing protein
MKKIIYAILLCFPAVAATFGQAVEAKMLGNWHNDDLVIQPWVNGRYNEIWGFAINGHEYAVLGSTEGLHIIDVTDPANIFEAFFVEGSSHGSHVVHRDFKTFKGHLYAVCDEGNSTLQIIDVNNLPNSVTQVYNSNEFVNTAHNLFIDTVAQRLYLNGAGFQTISLDISNPADPQLLAKYPNAALNLPYTHDCYVNNNIGIMNCGGSGLWLVDFSNPATPVLKSTLTSYVDAGYNHSGWTSEDGNYYFLCDEDWGHDIKVINISNLSDPEVITTLSPASWSGEIPHNCIVRGNLLYVSYYYDGLQVFDISDPIHPKRVAYYDTYPGANEFFYAGAWGVNPFLPSGNVLIGDIQGGMFLFEKITPPLDYSVSPNVGSFDICKGEPIEFDINIGDDYAGDVTLSVGVGSIYGDVAFIPNPAAPGSTVNVVVTNPAITWGQTENLFIKATDGTNSGDATVAISVQDAPYAAALIAPSDQATNVVLKPTLDWDAAQGASTYKLQVSKSLANFDNEIVFSLNTPASSFTFNNNLLELTNYYWRVTSRNDCGETASPIFAFTTLTTVNAITELDGNAVSVAPNPANEQLTMSFEEAVSEMVHFQLFTLSGQLQMAQIMEAGSKVARLETGSIPGGVYLLKMQTEKAVAVQKVVVGH